MAAIVENGEHRTPEQLAEHYRIEKELADRLRHAPRAERLRLYPAVYEELYRRVPLHPQLTRKVSAEETRAAVQMQMRLLERFLQPGMTFLEIGAGDCALSFAVAAQVKKVFALDVSAEVTRQRVCPANFELVLTDGCSVNLPAGSVDLAYSNQLMEHLHPEDAYEQLRNIYEALRPGGQYLCITPNRLNGPHDVSRYFSPVASGFHLKEYTLTELSRLFQKVGFSRMRAYLGVKGHFANWPVFPFRLCEALLEPLPHALRSALANRFPVRLFLEIRLVGTK